MALGLRETPVTTTRWLARKAAAASLMLGMAPPFSFPCSSPADTADAALAGSCPTATSAPYPAEEGPTVPTKPGPSALGRRWSQADNKGASQSQAPIWSSEDETREEEPAEEEPAEPQ
jgi:hypothetical protein